MSHSVEGLLGIVMRGQDDRVEGMFSDIRLDWRVPADHPLRAIRALADEVLAGLNRRFAAVYSGMGRPSIAPEMLLGATLLQAFLSVRSERQVMGQIDDNLLFRWFVGLPMDPVIWHPTVFSHNRDRRCKRIPKSGNRFSDQMRAKRKHGGCGARGSGRASGVAAGQDPAVERPFPGGRHTPGNLGLMPGPA